MIQVMLGQLGIVTSQQMFDQWRFVVVGATIAAAVLTPSTDPFTQVRSCGGCPCLPACPSAWLLHANMWAGVGRATKRAGHACEEAGAMQCASAKSGSSPAPGGKGPTHFTAPRHHVPALTPHPCIPPRPAQTLLAVPLVGLYLGGAGLVRLIEQRRGQAPA